VQECSGTAGRLRGTTRLSGAPFKRHQARRHAPLGDCAFAPQRCTPEMLEAAPISRIAHDLTVYPMSMDQEQVLIARDQFELMAAR